MEHFYQNINGWCHYLSPWYKHIVPQLPDSPRVVEVGCWLGRSTAFLAVELINNKKEFELWAVDHWLGCMEDFYEINSIKDSIRNDKPYEEFLENLAPVLDRISIIRDTSVRAAEQFEDNSLDMVVIDDDHDKNAVIHSIMAWMPKLKPGGYLCGDDHDQNYPGVINGVREIFGSDFTSYKVFTQEPGWSTVGIAGFGVFVVDKPDNWQPPVIAVDQDPWAYKIPFAHLHAEVPAPEPEPPEEIEIQEEKKTPITSLQNPKIRSII